MKRISVFTLAVLMLVPGTSHARSRYYGISVRFRTRYSPYAFSHKYTSGLISGELQYSPYAVGYYPAGLIPYWFRYSPYAFSHKHPSGLISDYGSYFYFPYSYSYSGLVDCDNNHNLNDYGYGNYNHPAERKSNYEKGLSSQIYRANVDRETDGKEIIYNYLKSKNVDAFEVDRVLKIENKTVSVSFVLRDKNLIIKYWNPEEIQVLLQQPGYRRSYYEKYEQNWKDFSQKYQQAGGKIYQIEAANGEEILSKLSLCPELSAG